MGLLRGVARTAVIAGTATSVSNRVSRRQAGRWAEQDQQAYETQAPPQQYAAPPPADDDGDMLAQLEKLGELRDKGILTEEEFSEQKARLLAG